MNLNLLEIKNFSLSYKFGKEKVYILRDINLSLLANKKVAIIGESGSGKSTLGHFILRLISDNEIEFSGEAKFFSKKSCCKEIDLCKGKFLDKKFVHIRGRHISMIFQDPFSALNPVIKIGKQIEEVILNHNKDISSLELRKKVENLLSLVNLDKELGIYDKFPHQLSGGQLQRICISIAIANKPELLIADEPTTSLDANLRKSILNLILDLVKINQMSLILITHDISIVRDYVDYIYVLYAGEIIEEANAEIFFNKPLHPYAQMLISCYPEKSKKGLPLPTIPGQIPDLRKKFFFDKCIFLDRCTKKVPKCDFSKPQFYKHKDSKVKCFLYE